MSGMLKTPEAPSTGSAWSLGPMNSAWISTTAQQTHDSPQGLGTGSQAVSAWLAWVPRSGACMLLHSQVCRHAPGSRLGLHTPTTGHVRVQAPCTHHRPRQSAGLCPAPAGSPTSSASCSPAAGRRAGYGRTRAGHEQLGREAPVSAGEEALPQLEYLVQAAHRPGHPGKGHRARRLDHLRSRQPLGEPSAAVLPLYMPNAAERGSARLLMQPAHAGGPVLQADLEQGSSRAFIGSGGRSAGRPRVWPAHGRTHRQGHARDDAKVAPACQAPTDLTARRPAAASSRSGSSARTALVQVHTRTRHGRIMLTPPPKHPA